MTPWAVVFTLEANGLITKKNLTEIKKSGFTRIPVYQDVVDNIVGLVYVKDLLAIPIGKRVKDVCRQERFLKVKLGFKLDELLNKFIQAKQHLALVVDEYEKLQGVVTLEDVIEEILKREIVDEDDRVADMQKLAKDKARV